MIAAIIGTRLGPVTAAEIRETLDLRRNGVEKRLMIFRRMPQSEAAYQQLQTDVLDAYGPELEFMFGEQPRWTPFTDKLDFQGLFFTSLTAHLLTVASPGYPPREGSI